MTRQWVSQANHSPFCLDPQKVKLDPQLRKVIEAKAHAFDLAIKEMGDKPIPKRKNKPIRANDQVAVAGLGLIPFNTSS